MSSERLWRDNRTERSVGKKRGKAEHRAETERNALIRTDFKCSLSCIGLRGA